MDSDLRPPAVWVCGSMLYVCPWRARCVNVSGWNITSLEILFTLPPQGWIAASPKGYRFGTNITNTSYILQVLLSTVTFLTQVSGIPKFCDLARAKLLESFHFAPEHVNFVTNFLSNRRFVHVLVWRINSGFENQVLVLRKCKLLIFASGHMNTLTIFSIHCRFVLLAWPGLNLI